VSRVNVLFEICRPYSRSRAAALSLLRAELEFCPISRARAIVTRDRGGLLPADELLYDARLFPVDRIRNGDESRAKERG